MKNKKSFIVYCLLSIVYCLSLSSCTKEPGKGGNSSIEGNLSQKNGGTKFNIVPPDEYVGADLDVYIIYGNDLSYSDRTKTDYEGDYEFKYLRKGNYKIYFYSMDSTLLGPNAPATLPPEIAYVKEVEITKRKQTVDVGKMTTFKAK